MLLRFIFMSRLPIGSAQGGGGEWILEEGEGVITLVTEGFWGGGFPISSG